MGVIFKYEYECIMNVFIQISRLKENTKFADVLSVISSSLFIAWIGSISIPLPMTPVPLTFRMHAILILSYFLGSKRALSSVALFLGLGSIFPIFAGSTFGIAALLGPSGGYIMGYLFAALLVGFLGDTKKSFLGALLLGMSVIYFAGITHLSLFFGFSKALELGFFPFILANLAQTFFAYTVYKFIKK